MKITKTERLLNDSEVNYHADLFLGHFGFDRSDRRYRYLRNTMILCSHGFLSPEECYLQAANCANTDIETFMRELEDFITDTKEPIHTVYNKFFSPELLPYEHEKAYVKMSECENFYDVLSFLSGIFLYLNLVVFNNYGRIEYIGKKYLNEKYSEYFEKYYEERKINKNSFFVRKLIR